MADQEKHTSSSETSDAELEQTPPMSRKQEFMKDVKVEVKSSKKERKSKTTQATKDDVDSGKHTTSLRAKIASQEAERRQKLLAEAKERVDNYKKAQKHNFIERSSAKLPASLLVTRVQDKDSVLSQFRRAARLRHDLSAEVSPFLSKYSSTLKSDEDVTVNKAVASFCESVVPNDTVGCGWMVGAANVHPKEISHLPKPGSYQSVEEFLEFYQQFERTETPILDPKTKLNYEDAHKWMAVMTATGCKFSATYFGALKFVSSQIKANASRFTAGGALAITELEGAIQSCNGVDNTTRNLIDCDSKASYGRREWTTSDLLSAMRDPHRRDKIKIKEELQYRASGKSNKFYLSILNLPSTKVQMTTYLDAIKNRIWLRNCLDQCEQQQAYVKWLCTYFRVNSKYRSSINFIPYQIYVYLLNTQVTEEQKVEINSLFQLPPVVRAPDKTGTPVDHIVDAEYSMGSKSGGDQTKGRKIPFYKSCSKCNNWYDPKKVGKRCEEHQDFRIPSEDIVSEGISDVLFGHYWFVRGGDELMRNVTELTPDMEDSLHAMADTAVAKRMEGYTFNQIEVWFLETLADIRPAMLSEESPSNDQSKEGEPPVEETPDDARSATSYNSIQESEPKSKSFLNRTKKWISQTTDDIKTVKTVFDNRKIIGETLKDIKDADLIHKASAGIDNVMLLAQEVKERGLIQTGDDMIKKMTKQLDELNRIRTEWFTDDTMSRIKKTLENSDFIISSVSRIMMLIDPIVKGIESYFPKEVQEFPSFAKIVKDFPYVAALIVLVTWSKSKSPALRTVAVINFLAQAGIMNVVLTICSKVWTYLQEKFPDKAKKAEDEVKNSTSAGEAIEEVDESFFSSLINFIVKNGMTAAVWTGVILAVGSVCSIGMNSMMANKSDLESTSAFCAKSLVGAGVTANAGFRIGQFVQMMTGAMKSIAGFFYKCVTGKEWEAEIPAEVESVRDLLYSCNFYNTKTGARQLFHQAHLDAAKDVLKRWDRFSWEAQIKSNVVSQRFVQRYHSNFEKLRTNVGIAVDWQIILAGERVPPTVVYMYGKPGGGKSSTMTKIMKKLAKEFYGVEGLEYEKICAAMDFEKEFQDTCTVYTRIVSIDDYNSVNEATKVTGILQAASGAPYYFNKADLPDKPTPCNIEFMFLTSNMEKVRAEGLNTPEALDRRRDVVLHFDIKKDWLTPNGVLDMDKWTALSPAEQAKDPHVNIFIRGSDGTDLSPDSWLFKEPSLPFFGKTVEWARNNPITWEQAEQIIRYHHHMRRAQNTDTRGVDPFRNKKAQMKALYETLAHYLDPDDDYVNKTLADWGFDTTQVTGKKIFDACHKQLEATMDEVTKGYAVISALRDKPIEDMIPAFEDLPPIRKHDKNNVKGKDGNTSSSDEELYGVFYDRDILDTNYPSFSREKKTLQQLYQRVKFDDITVNAGEDAVATFHNDALQVYRLSDVELNNILHPFSSPPFVPIHSCDVPLNNSSVRLPENICSKVDTGCDYEFLRRVQPLSSRSFKWLGMGPWQASVVEKTRWFAENVAAYDKNVPDIEERRKIRSWVISKEKELSELTKTRDIYLHTVSLWNRTKKNATSILHWLKTTLKDLAAILLELFMIASLGCCVALTFIVIREAVRDEVNYAPVTSSGPYSGSKESGMGKLAAQAAKSVVVTVPAATSISDPTVANLLVPTETENMSQIKNKVLLNQRLIQVNGRNAHGLFVEGNLMLIPAHILPGLKETQKVKIFSFGMDNGVALEQEYHVPYSNVFAIENRDLAMIKIENHTAVKSITKYFPDVVDMYKLFYCDGKGGVSVKYLHGYATKKGTILTFREVDAVMNNVVANVDLNNNGDVVQYANIISVDQVLPAGSSGAVAFQRYPGNDAKIIVGIVTGRNEKIKIGYITCVTKSDVLSLVKAFNDVYVKHDVDLPGAEVSWADPLEVPSDLCFDGCRPFFVGVIEDKKAINPFPSSKLRPSPICTELNQMHPSDRVPVITHRFHPRWKKYEYLGIAHPMSHSLTKGVRDSVPEVDWNELDICVRQLADYITRRLGGRRPKVWTFEQAITNETGRMNPKSSPGRVWKVFYPECPGKSGLFRLNEKGEIAWVNPTFKEYCETTFEMRKKGIIPPTEFYTFLKDELRPVEKEWKGRQIDVGGAEEALQFRMLCGHLFQIMVELGNGMNQWCFGINPVTDWRNIGEEIRAMDKGKYCSANDVQNWDGHQTLQWVKAACQVINLVYRDGPEYQRARMTYGIGMVSAYVTFGRYVIQKERGMSSGSGGTTMLNTLIHMLVAYFMWRTNVERHWDEFRLFGQSRDVIKSFSFYNNVVVNRFYSDDIITAVNPLIAPIYNPGRVADLYRELGLPVTTSAQSKGAAEVEFVSYTKIDFLKRSFYWDDQLKRWFARLRVGVLYDMLRYVRSNDPTETRMQMASNYQDAYREAAQHGKAFFEAFVAEITTLAAQKGISLEKPVWEDVVHISTGRIIDDPEVPDCCVMAGPSDEPENDALWDTSLTTQGKPTIVVVRPN